MIFRFCCLALLALACSPQLLAAETCELTMGYRTNARAPILLKHRITVASISACIKTRRQE
ncbi:hypothetical protein ACWAU3_20790 [Shewanella sp. JL219SE-S6]